MRDFDEKVKSAANFLRLGVATGAECILVTRREDMEEWRNGLDKHDPTLSSRRVAIIPIESWLPPRGINSVRMARRLYDRIEAARANSRELHVAIDMAWSLETRTSSGEVCHWEATRDHLIAMEADVYFLCVYGLYELGYDFLHAALRTHNVIVVGGESFPNPYFEAPEILEKEPALNPCSSDPELVGGMLQHFFAAV